MRLIYVISKSLKAEVFMNILGASRSLGFLDRAELSQASVHLWNPEKDGIAVFFRIAEGVFISGTPELRTLCSQGQDSRLWCMLVVVYSIPK